MAVLAPFGYKSRHIKGLVHIREQSCLDMETIPLESRLKIKHLCNSLVCRLSVGCQNRMSMNCMPGAGDEVSKGGRKAKPIPKRAR